MEIRGVFWLEEIVDKLDWKHGVRQYEVEEVLYGRPHIRFTERGERPGENLYSALGQTESGRRLTVFFIRKRDGTALVISARDMSRTERRRYGRR